MVQISEEDKKMLVEMGSDLQFEDDVSEYLCVECEQVALDHYVSECGHLFCRNCQIAIYVKENYRCPNCQEIVESLKQKSEELEQNLYALCVKCPNQKRGCKTQASLEEIAFHLKKCRYAISNFPVASAQTETTELKAQMKLMMQKMCRLETMLNKKMEEPKHQQVSNDSYPPPHYSQLEAGSFSSQHPPQQMQSLAEPESAFEMDATLMEIENLKQKVAKLENQLQFQSPSSNQLENSSPSIVKPQENTQVEELLKMVTQRFNLEMDLNNQAMDTSNSPNVSNPHPTVAIQKSKFNGIPGKTYNILLLGPTGVGKSTFINAFYNYLMFDNMDEARKCKLEALIACSFEILDENHVSKTVTYGHDDNERTRDGESSTQSCKAYEFSVDNITLRIIDTPGIGDTKGIKYDRFNLKNMLQFLSKYDELYAICILLKPNESRLTPFFSFCIKQLLCHLHQKASNNIVFVFTNSRNTFYRPGDTVKPLNKILEQVRNAPPYPKLAFGKSNTFCLDNESFRFLIATQKGIYFEDSDFRNYEQSWLKSVEESNRMIRYIVEGSEGHRLTPHMIKETLSINEARQAIINLSQPLTDIAKNLQMNIQVLNQQKEAINACKNDVSRLKKVLYMPKVTLKIKELDQPCTVCTGESCRKAYKMGDLINYHYPKKCHTPCYLKEVPKEVVGFQKLQYCWAMNEAKTHCRLCKCHFAKHLHIYYESEEENIQEIDPNIQKQLKTKDGVIAAANEMIENLEEEMQKYKFDQKVLSKYTAKLAVYLMQNAMVVQNDSFKEHLEVLIENEKSLNQRGSNNADIIKGLEEMVRNYEKEKAILDNALQSPNKKLMINLEEVLEIIDKISSMDNFGIAFANAIAAQDRSSQNIVKRMYNYSKEKMFG